MMEQLAALNDEIAATEALVAGAAVVWAFALLGLIVAAILAISYRPSVGGRRFVVAVTGLVAVFASLPTAQTAYFQPRTDGLEARKAEVCKSVFETFAETRDADLARNALNAGCDRDELVVIALSRGDGQTARTVQNLVAEAD